MGFLDALVLGPAILEPDLDLSFGQVKSFGKLESPRPRNILVALILDFQPERLIRGESCPLPSLSRISPSPSGH